MNERGGIQGEIEAVAVFVALVLVVPAVSVATLEFTPALVSVTTTWNVADAPEASVAMEQLTVPLAPTDGLVQVNVGPALCDVETKSPPAGSG